MKRNCEQKTKRKLTFPSFSLNVTTTCAKIINESAALAIFRCHQQIVPKVILVGRFLIVSGTVDRHIVR